MFPFKRCRRNIKCIFVSLCTVSTISLYVYSCVLNNNKNSSNKLNHRVELQVSRDALESVSQNENEERNDGEILCKIPKLDPHNKVMVKLIEDEFASRRGGPPPCVNNNATKFKIDLDSNLIRIYDGLNKKNVNFWSEAVCYFQQYKKDPKKPDFAFIFAKIKKVSSNVTHLPGSYEFLSVWCFNKSTFEKSGLGPESKSEIYLIYEDHLAHIPMKKKFLSPPSSSSFPKDQNPPEKMSIIVLGMDMLSRSNFLRTMPKSYHFLLDKMEAVDFTSFNSLGWVTWDSVMPLLTGLAPSDLRRDHCLWISYINKYPLDNCPFVWKSLAASGYATSYSDEDAAGIKPFLRSPSLDYDFRDFVYSKRKEAIVGHDENYNELNRRAGHNRMCMGSRLTFSVHLDIILRMAHRFKEKPFFHFSWAGLLTNSLEVIAYSQFADEPLLKLLEQLTKKKLMENTALILIGDHGLRGGPARTTTSQGFFEERLPLLMIALPPNFKSRFPAAAKNFRKNQNRLVTAFDVHATLIDFSHLADLTDNRVEERAHNQNLDTKGSSLFLPVSTKRTCETFFPRSPHLSFCACLPASSEAESGDPNSANVQFLATRLVDEVNERLADFRQHCEPWSVKKVMKVSIFKNHIESYSRPEYLIEELLFIKTIARHYRNLYKIQLETTLGHQFSAYLTQTEHDGGYGSVGVLEVSRIFGLGAVDGQNLNDQKKCVDLQNVPEGVKELCHCS